MLHALISSLRAAAMLWIHPRRDYRKLQALYNEADYLLSTTGEALTAPVKKVSGWSPAQHLHHTAQVNMPLFDWLGRCCRGDRSSSESGRPNFAGRLVLFLGRLPRGRARAPERFRPPDEVAVEAAKGLLDESRKALDVLADCVPRLRGLDCRQQHPRLGVLNAAEWLRFAYIHTRHHLVIVRDILAER